MKIDRNQLRHMVDNSDFMLKVALKNLITEQHPHVISGLPDDIFNDMIENSLAAAKTYGFKDSPDLSAFVMWCFEFGPEFHKHSAIQAILADSRLEPRQKISTILQNIPEKVWRECEAAIHRMTWFPELRNERAD